MNNTAGKLNKANALLLGIRNFVKIKTLRYIYSQTTYFCIVWAQNNNPINRLIIFQKKALQIMSFKDQLFHWGQLLDKHNILKYGDKTTLENILFVNKPISWQVPPIIFLIGLHFLEICIDVQLAGL